jgi:predicted enzyme related to lactoylglutathione lyase
MMPTRNSAPAGSPCWADLWTSDVEGSRKFYAEVFGWKAEEPSPEFGGYFMFTRDGVPVAGAMGDMGDMRADNTWKIYLCTDDIARTADAAAATGANIAFPPTAVADLGSQMVFVDPTGAPLGAWQPGTFPGFTVFGEHGAPDWFELHTRDYETAVSFYRDVFGWETSTVNDSGEFRYTTMKDPNSDGWLAGILDARATLPQGTPPHWSIYWNVDDVDAAARKVRALGGSVVTGVDDTPYGKVATVTDPAGAYFRLRTPPR